MEVIARANLGEQSNSEMPSLSKIVPLNPDLISNRVKQIWAVGGGKGGIGKSFLASSIAISLAKMGNTVIAIDLDLGGANLHTVLGLEHPRKSLNDYLMGHVAHLKDCVVPSGIPNLGLICGSQNTTHFLSDKKSHFLDTVKTLNADYLVFDLGAGMNDYTLDFFILSDIRIVTILPEPTSIENAYRFIRSCYFKYLASNETLRDIRSLIEMAIDSRNEVGIQSPNDLFRHVNKVKPECIGRLTEEIKKFSPYIVINQARTKGDIDIGNSIKVVCKKYFGIDAEYTGHLDYDSSVWQSVRRKKPLMLDFPDSGLVTSVEKIIQNIIKWQTLKIIK